MSPQISFYGNPDFLTKWRIFQNVCEQNNTSASSEIRKFVLTIVDEYDPEKFQKSLTLYSSELDKNPLTDVKDVAAIIESEYHDKGQAPIKKDILARFLYIENGNQRMAKADAVIKILSKKGIKTSI